jgi:hypothetical protein
MIIDVYFFLAVSAFLAFFSMPLILLKPWEKKERKEELLCASVGNTCQQTRPPYALSKSEDQRNVAIEENMGQNFTQMNEKVKAYEKKMLDLESRIIKLEGK